MLFNMEIYFLRNCMNIKLTNVAKAVHPFNVFNPLAEANGNADYWIAVGFIQRF